MQADGAVLPLRYQLVRELGRGGMGVVYLATDSEFGEVAIKLLPPHGSQSEDAVRFQREARDLAGLSHPNVVRLLEAGEGQERDYIVMEYVGGGSLKDLAGKATLRETLEIFEQVCHGLAYIHERGLVHRDLKPDNVLLTPGRQPKITDFGIARRVEQRTKLTQAGSILGTCDYLPPEQIISSQVGPAADLYSLGVCLFEAVTGRLPFVEDMEFRVLQAHVKTPPPVPSTLRAGLPPALDDLIGQLLQKRPEQRPENATRVASRLADIVTQLPSLGDAAPGLELAGRAPVLDNLLGIVTQGVRGAGVAALLVGDRGFGRSVLLDHLLKRLRAEPGARILRLAPAPIGQALPGLWSRLGRDPAELEKLYAATGREGVAQGVARVLAAQEPVALIVDDYERLDSLTRYVVTELVKTPAPPRTCWLVSLRSEEREDFPEGVPTVTLEGLERKALLELAEAWLGGRPGPRLEGLLVERTGGSPRKLRLLCGCLTAIGLDSSGGTVELRDDPPPLDDLVRTVLSQRGGLLEVARLTMWARDAASRELLLAASELPADQVKTVITELEKRGLLEWQPGYPADEEEPRLRFALPTLAAKIRGEGSGTAVHVQLARSLPQGPERARHLGLGKQPQARQALADQAARLRAAGCVEEELELWVLASEVSKGAEQGEARIQAARCRSELGLGSQAVAELTALLDNPVAETWRPLVVVSLARALARSGDAAGALAQLDQEAEPEEASLAVQDLELRSELQDDPAEKRDLLQQAVSRSHPLPAVEQLRLELLLGERQLEAGQDREARRVLESSLSRARSVDNPFWLTRCLLALGRSYAHDRAIPCFDQALDACGGAYPARLEAELWRSLSRAYEAKRDLASACAAWERAEGLDSQDKLHLAQLQRASGQLGRAERTLRDLQDPAAQLQLGLLLVAAGRPEEAIAHLDGARGPEALCALTEAYMKQEKYAEAVITAEKALAAARHEEGGDWPIRARVLLAEACVADQMWESAARNLIEARALDPGEELLERIRQAEERLPAGASRVVVEAAPAVNPPAVREVKPPPPPPSVPEPAAPKAPPSRRREDYEPLPSTLAIDKIGQDDGGRKLPVKALAVVAVVVLLLGGVMVLGKGKPSPDKSPDVVATAGEETPAATPLPKKSPEKKPPPGKKPPAKKPTPKPKATPKPVAAKPTPKPAAAKPAPRPKPGTPTAAGPGALISVLLAVVGGLVLGLGAGVLKGRGLAAEGAIPADVQAESQVAARGTLGLVLIAALGTGAFLGPPWYKLFPLSLVYTNVSAALAEYLPAGISHLTGVFVCFLIIGVPLSTVVSAVVKAIVSRLPSRLSPD